MSYLPCPKTKCEGILDLKQAKRGASKGEYFYGCTNFSNSQVNCKVTVDKEGIFEYLNNELFNTKNLPQPSNKLLWNDDELNGFNAKQLVMICYNNGYDVGNEAEKNNLINLIKYFQTSYFKCHRNKIIFSKPIMSDYLFDFEYTFVFDDLIKNKYNDTYLDFFLTKKNKKIVIKNFIDDNVGQATISRNKINLKFTEGIKDSLGYELLTVFDFQKTNCKFFVVSGEATLDLFNDKDELFLEILEKT